MIDSTGNVGSWTLGLEKVIAAKSDNIEPPPRLTSSFSISRYGDLNEEEYVVDPNERLDINTDHGKLQTTMPKMPMKNFSKGQILKEKEGPGKERKTVDKKVRFNDMVKEVIDNKIVNKVTKRNEETKCKCFILEKSQEQWSCTQL